ncbi:hypothetical protein HanPI659440_Chr16g0657071 [Helianthus annuus]|nr:hypothetical protein HanPI659440_Chr16g0657071 [Helianthus annuus]
MHHLSLSNRFTSSSPNPSSPIKSTTHGLFALLPVRTNEPPTPASAGIAGFVIQVSSLVLFGGVRSRTITSRFASMQN